MKVRKTPLFLVLLLAATTSLAATGKYSAIIYEAGSNRSKKLFTLDVDYTGEGADETANVAYKDLNGELVVIEKATIKGNVLTRMEIEQRQIKATAVVEYKDGHAYFTKTQDGKTKKEDETVKGDFVMSGNFQAYVRSKWSDLMAGKTIDMRYGVWDRMETVGFSIRKKSEQGEGDKKTVTLYMKATNFVIAALVNPLTFEFTGDGSRMLALSGRVSPKLKNGDKYSDLDAEMVYSYP